MFAMALLAWLAGVATEELTVGGIRRATRFLAGSETERVFARAIGNAIEAAVAEAVDPNADIGFAMSVLRELLVQVDPGGQAGSALDKIESAIHAALGELWADASHPEQLGFRCTREELATILVEQLVTSIGLYCSPDAHPTVLFAILQGQQVARGLARSTKGAAVQARAKTGQQALLVNAWVSVARDPPEVVVFNNSDAPIFDVTPTPALVGYGSAGLASAMVGNAPLGTARQIDPRAGWVWPMFHCAGWGASGAVRSELHVSFKDASQRGWLLAHDHLSLTEDPWDAT